MKNLNHKQVLEQLKTLLNEDITEVFHKEQKIAGEHGEPTFTVTGSQGRSIEVGVDWDKEADELMYVIYQEN
ncbi:hypothetical protein [Ornithinibacillus xuwenensis]|uniref:Uncharacterized protein n=1 Tax=Ornithinibacillus xuwenensis TaxID=3144668 RepID=A0ABU9XJM8_9BACI